MAVHFIPSVFQVGCNIQNGLELCLCIFSFTDPKVITFADYLPIKAQSGLPLRTVTVKSYPLVASRKLEDCVVVHLVKQEGPEGSRLPSANEAV
jgi:hypothetical protein